MTRLEVVNKEVILDKNDAFVVVDVVAAVRTRIS
tara:strand:- start:197 stop:298 length:102 start_codon:yes stop_codon:yes gene_type:complete